MVTVQTYQKNVNTEEGESLGVGPWRFHKEKWDEIQSLTQLPLEVNRSLSLARSQSRRSERGNGLRIKKNGEISQAVEYLPKGEGT